MKVFKKIMAVLAVLVMIALYVAVVLCAVFIKKVGNKVFLAVFVTALLVPLLLYLVSWLYNLFQPKHPIDDRWEAKKKKGFQEAAALSNLSKAENSVRETHNSKQASAKESIHENEEEDGEA